MCNFKLALDICTNIGYAAIMIRRDITAELVGAAKEYPVVTIFGPRQSGKTTLARELESSRRAVRLCPDEWIKTIIRDESDKTELDRLRKPVEKVQWDLARRLLGLGATVILEYGFWSEEERTGFRAEARALGARVELHYLDPPKEELWKRIELRNSNLPGGSFPVVRGEFEAWWEIFQAPGPEELKTFDNGR